MSSYKELMLTVGNLVNEKDEFSKAIDAKITDQMKDLEGLKVGDLVKKDGESFLFVLKSLDLFLVDFTLKISLIFI